MTPGIEITWLPTVVPTGQGKNEFAVPEGTSVGSQAISIPGCAGVAVAPFETPSEYVPTRSPSPVGAYGLRPAEAPVGIESAAKAAPSQEEQDEDRHRLRPRRVSLQGGDQEIPGPARPRGQGLRHQLRDDGRLP